MFCKAIFLTQEAFRTISRHKGVTTISFPASACMGLGLGMTSWMQKFGRPASRCSDAAHWT